MFWTPQKPPTRLESVRSAANERAHELSDVVHDVADGVGQHLESLKLGAVEKLATTRAQLDSATKKATAQAEKDAFEARIAAEKERAVLIAEHEKWKAQMEAERAQFEKKALEKRLRDRAFLLRDEDELDVYPLDLEATSSSKGSSLFLLIGAIILVIVALFFLLSGTQGRRSRATIKGRLDQVKDGSSDATTKSADNTAERLESIELKSDAKLAVIADEMSGTSAAPANTTQDTEGLGDKIEAIGDSIAYKIETLGERAAEAAKEAADKIAENHPKVPGDSPVIPELVPVSPASQTTRELENEIEATLDRIEASARGNP